MIERVVPPAQPMMKTPLFDSKPWPEMTRKEKLAAYDEITKAFREFADEVRREIDELLAAKQCTMRTTVLIHLDVDPNDDPRLPCTHKHWDPAKHGRHCDCGALMYDPGD